MPIRLDDKIGVMLVKKTLRDLQEYVGEIVAAYAGDAAATPATFGPAAETAAIAFTAEQLAAGEIAYLKDLGFALK